MVVFVELERSASPPINVGTCLAMALIATPLVSRVATALVPPGYEGRSASQPLGSRFDMAASHSPTRSGYLAAHLPNSLFQSSSQLLPRSNDERKCSRAWP